MGFLRRLLRGQAAQPRPVMTFSVDAEEDGYDPADGLCFVTVGDVTLPAAIYLANERDDGDFSAGLRLEDPRTGDMLFRESEYPSDFLEAGARSIAIVGIPHHPDAQRPEFGVGSIVQLVSEPTNPYDPHAIAFRSFDGRYLAGYVSREDNASVRATRPAPTVGVVAWEHYTLSPRVRRGLIALIGPTVSLRVVPARDVPAEAARRRALYAAGRRED